MNAADKIPQDLCRPINQSWKLSQSSVIFSEPDPGHLIDLPFMEWEEEEAEMKKKGTDEPNPPSAKEEPEK